MAFLCVCRNTARASLLFSGFQTRSKHYYGTVIVHRFQMFSVCMFKQKHTFFCVIFCSCTFIIPFTRNTCRSTGTYEKIVLQLPEAMNICIQKIFRDITDSICLKHVNYKYNPMLNDFGEATPLSDAPSKQKCLSSIQQEEYRKKHQHIAPELVFG